MGKTFEEKLREYARIGLKYGLGYDQRFGDNARPLYVECYQTEDHGFFPVLAEEAYKLGAPIVVPIYRNIELERAQLMGAPEDGRFYMPMYYTAWAKDCVAKDGARLALDGNGALGVMDDAPAGGPEALDTEFRKATEPLLTRRVNMQQPWTILNVPTKAWAGAIGMTTEELWEFLFEVSGANREDGVNYALGIAGMLLQRCVKLDELGICTLSFFGKDTDLTVGLTPRARWIGGRKQAEDGTWFGPNWPSFEVFTTPDFRLTEGRVRVTMSSTIGGHVVNDLVVKFKDGRVTDFDCPDEYQRAIFRHLISRDDGACMLGEIALVGLDAPLAKFTEPHLCVMLDENKRCHMAVGRAYTACIEGGAVASEDELAELGCNVSAVHHDITISDETTTVVAHTYDGNEVVLLEDGHWAEEFAPLKPR